MQLRKLTPLQSRLLASASATCLALALWTCVEPQNFVHAAEIPVPESAPNSEFIESIPLALRDASPIGTVDQGLEERSDGIYAPDFAYFDRSVVGRQEEEVKQLTDNKKEDGQAAPGSTRYFRFKPAQSSSKRAQEIPDDVHGVDNISKRNTVEEDDIDGDAEENDEGGIEKRQNSRRIWISANACSAPLPNVTLITDKSPQLTLYVSTSANNQKPGPTTPDTTAVPFVSGFANLTLQTGNEVYMGVSAPDLTDGWNGSWSYELAASVQGQYHNYANSSQFIFLVDTDSESALFITHNFTDQNSPEEVEKWRNRNPFDMYAFPTANWSNMNGLEASYCGLKSQFEANGIQVNKNITTIFGKGVPVSQFHISGLRTNTNYTGFLTMAGSDTETMELPDLGTVRAGGGVFRQFQWTTKAGMSPVPLSLPYTNNTT
jgi:calcium channel MID1